MRYGWAGVLSAILLAAAANAILGVLQFTGFVESAAHLQIDARFTRAYGSYEQPNPFAGLMGMTAPRAALAAVGYATRALATASRSVAMAKWIAMVRRCGLRGLRHIARRSLVHVLRRSRRLVGWNLRYHSHDRCHTSSELG